MKISKVGQIKSVVRFALFIILSVGFLCGNLYAQRGDEYRGFWVDTFNTPLNNHNDVLAVINNVKAAKANAIFAQVRRRGDAWYLNSLEPKPDFTPFAAGFDPLTDLINEAHANGIEVHAFVIMSAVWNKNPAFGATTTLGPPLNDNHVFNLHGWNKATNSMRTGRDNWLTKTLLPDGTNGIAFQGQRFGSDFWLDFGHPDAEAYMVNVLTHLVQNYDIDGLHLDRIRYPEFSVLTGQSSQTPINGTSIGYNETSVSRFNARYNRTGTPLASDAQWKQWRRDQVTNVVRRVYLNAVAVKPQIKISAALIAFGGGPTTEAGWNSADAYWRVYQDWRAWTEEGILDIAIPMDYKREHTPAEAVMFNQWSDWVKNHQYNRAGMVGPGGLSNSVEGTIRQLRRALAPTAAGNSGVGINIYSLATSNVAVTANPWSFPVAGQNTPARSFADFASGLTTGKSVNGATFYENLATNPIAVFSQKANIPALSWKIAPVKGHLMGFAKRDDNSALDTADVTITNLDNNNSRSTATDGGGFYGGVDLTPGEYLVKAQLGGETLYSCVENVVAGTVATADLHTETTAPTTSASFDPTDPSGSNGWYKTDVTVSLSASDNCTGVAATEYSLDGTNWMPYTGSILISDEGATTVKYGSTDRAGNHETVNSVTVQIDKTAPTTSVSIDPSVPNGANGWYKTDVTISLSSADSRSGVAATEYSIDGGANWLPYASSFSISNEGITTVQYRSTDNAGNVETAKNITVQIDKTAPTTSASLDPTAPNGLNGWYTRDVAVNFSATDNSSGVAGVEYSINGAGWLSYTNGFSITNEGVTNIRYRSTDVAGNVETAKTITVRIDKSAPTVSLSANPSRLRSPNGKPVTVQLRGTGADAVSGLASVSYTVTDEYGTSLSIPTRTLSGNSANWTDSIELEASRNGDDADGRVYHIVATITDVAGYTSTASADVVVPHDQRNH